MKNIFLTTSIILIFCSFPNVFAAENGDIALNKCKDDDFKACKEWLDSGGDLEEHDMTFQKQFCPKLSLKACELIGDFYKDNSDPILAYESYTKGCTAKTQSVCKKATAVKKDAEKAKIETLKAEKEEALQSAAEMKELEAAEAANKDNADTEKTQEDFRAQHAISTKPGCYTIPYGIEFVDKKISQNIYGVVTRGRASGNNCVINEHGQCDPVARNLDVVLFESIKRKLKPKSPSSSVESIYLRKKGTQTITTTRGLLMQVPVFTESNDCRPNNKKK